MRDLNKREINKITYNKSKAKGSAFEYKVRDIFSKHFGKTFERVPMSGALDYLKGDIFCPEMFNNFPYTVECKHYKALNFNSLLTAKSNDLWAFWEQATEECAVMRKLNPKIKPIVVFRWDRSKNFVMWDDDIDLKTQLEVKAFGVNVKIGLLDDWLKQIKL